MFDVEMRIFFQFDELFFVSFVARSFVFVTIRLTRKLRQESIRIASPQMALFVVP